MSTLHMNNATLWNSVKWRLVEARIARIQRRIYNASKADDKGRVVFLQNLLINSLDAKLMAVRHVTTLASGRGTPGVDSVVVTTAEEKDKMVSALAVDGYAAPIRRIWIPKPGRAEKRPLGIPVIKDRAKQKLVLMALEPEWETRFEPNSYGFRPGRSCHDAVEAIYRHLRNANSRSTGKYILDADLKGCFNNIRHDYLLQTLASSPRIQAQVKAWLEAGIFEGFSLAAEDYGMIAPNTLGTPQGGVISPFLANVALHGMENQFHEWVCTQNWPVEKRHSLYTINKKKSLGVIRYADDFVVIHKDKNIVEGARDTLKAWLLTTSGLSFNEEKTRIVHSTEGFDFLGFSFINISRNGKMRIKIYPSKKNQKKFIDNIGDFARKHRSLSAYDLIKALRPKILGWGNYFCKSECQLVFSSLDKRLYSIISKWAFRRDKRHGKYTVKEKYFPSGKEFTFDNRTYRNNWILCGKKATKGSVMQENFLPKLSWISSKKHVSVKTSASVYNGQGGYWASRSTKYGGFNVRQRTLLASQKGKCPFCRGKIMDNFVQVDHIIPRHKGGKDAYHNLQLLHTHCHIQKTAIDAG